MKMSKFVPILEILKDEINSSKEKISSIADGSNVNPCTIYKFLKGQRHLSAVNIDRLMKYFNLKVVKQ